MAYPAVSTGSATITAFRSTKRHAQHGARNATCTCDSGWTGERCQLAPAYELRGSAVVGLRGVYQRTTHNCGGRPVYQLKDEGVSGAVLFRAAGQSGWMFGLASRMDDCIDRGYIDSEGADGICPEAPDGAGCTGRWRGSGQRNDDRSCADGGACWIDAPWITVVAVGA